MGVEDTDIVIISEAQTIFGTIASVVVQGGASCVKVDESKVREITRAWAGRWVLQLLTGAWIRAPLVVCGPLATPGMWVSRLAEIRGVGCPWDGLPTEAFNCTSGEWKRLADLQPGVVLVLGLATEVRASV